MAVYFRFINLPKANISAEFFHCFGFDEWNTVEEQPRDNNLRHILQPKVQQLQEHAQYSRETFWVGICLLQSAE